MRNVNENIFIVQDFLGLFSVGLNLKVFIHWYNVWKEFPRSLSSKKFL